ncbi:hypothetical protein ACPCKW_09685 [Streptomyces griseoincarnatus]
MNIELLVVSDCPHAGPPAKLFRRVLVSIGLDGAAFITRVISDTREVEAEGFTGSPSFMVDGRDLFAEPGRSPGTACRVYRTPNGLAGLPGLYQMRRALLGAFASNDQLDRMPAYPREAERFP